MNTVAEQKMTRAEAIARLTAPGQPGELREMTIAGNRCRVFVNAPPTLRELVSENRGAETFYVYEDEQYSFEEMYRRAASVASVLVDEYGIGQGDRVAISMRNYPEWVIAFTAITSIGAIAVALNALWTAEEMEYGLKHSGARVLFADQERLERLSRCSDSVNVDVIAVRPTDTSMVQARLFDDMIDNKRDMPAADIHPDDDAIMLYTSGSTGHPKGAVSTHRNVISALLSWELDGAAAALIHQFGRPARPYQIATLLGVPLFHVSGLHAVLLSSYRSQRKVVAMYKWDTEKAAELIEHEKIASFVAPAAMTGDLVETAKRTERDLSSLVSVGGGGAPRAADQVRNISKTFGQAMPGTGWGMTETNAIGTGIAGQDYLTRPESSGRCSAVLDIAIVDEQGNHLPPNQRGELLVRGTAVFRGYWENPEANEDAFVDGWFRTGDVAYIDDEGFLFIVDRLKQLIIRGGENIGCGEVEAALVEHPDIIEASVYGVPDERLGEEVGATVYATRALDDDEIREFLRDHLGAYQIPRYIFVSREALPRIASGKIDKLKIKDRHLRQAGL